MFSNHLILCCPLLLLSVFPSIEVFSSELALKYCSFRFRISPSNEYSGLISLQSRGLSRVFSSTAIQKHQFFSTQPSLWSNSHICTWHSTGCALCVQLCLTLCDPWTVACQTPLSMGFSRQECWVGCHFVFQRIFPIPGTEADSLPLSHLGKSIV